MKLFKKVSLVCLLALPLMVGCGGKSYKETRTEEELVNELAKQALSEVGVVYSKFASDGVVLGDTELVMTVNEKIYDGDEFGLDFTLKYSVSPQEEYKREYLKLNEAGNVLTSEILAENELNADQYPIASSLGGAAYSFKADITFKGYAEGFKAPSGLKTTGTFVGQKIASQSWNALVKSIKSGTISEIKNSAYQADDVVLTKGVVTTAYNWIYDEIFRGVIISDGDDGILLYAGILQSAFYDSADGPAKIKIGDVIQVYGVISPYNGLFEIKPSKITVLGTDLAAEGIAPASYRELTVEQLNACKEKDTGALCEIKDLKLATTAVSLAKFKVGEHWTITAKDANDKKLTIYVNYHVGAEAQEDILAMLKGLGSKLFTIKAPIAAYNGMQITPMMIGNNSAASCFIVQD